MGVRATCTHITSESNDTIRVDLIGQAYGGASREVIGNGRSWMRFSHDQLDYANVFNTPVQRGRLEFSFMVQSDDDRSVVTDVLATAQGEYTMAYYRNGTLQWIGEVMMDQLGSLSVGEPYPYAVTLVARDFVPLEGQLFPLEDNRQLATTVLGRLLSATGYDLPIWTHTSWVTSGTNSSNDFLRQVYVDTRNLREFNKEGDIQITYLEALTRMVAPFKAVLRQAGGVFVLDQLSAYETPSSVLRTIYDKDGAYQSQSNVNTTVSANASVTVVRGSIDEIKPGYKRAAITYNHRTPQSDILFLPRVVLTVAEPSDVTGSEFIEQGREIALVGEAFVNYSSAVASNDRPFASIEIEHNGYYWNDALKVWQNSSYTNFYTMQPSNQLPGINLDDTAYDIFNVPINIRTLPTVTSGLLTVKLKKSSNPSGITSETVYLNMDFQIITDSEDEGSTAIRYVTEQALSFTQNYDGGSYYFGDGPTQRSPSALRKSTTVTDLTTSWTRRGDSDDWEFHEIALKEIMDHYRGYGRVGSYIIKQGNYTPLNVLAFETRALYYVGGQFNGFTGWWSPILFQLDLVTGTDQLVVGYVSGPSLITSTTLTAVSLATNNSIEANANYVFRLATQVSGTVTQLSLEPMNVQYPLLRKDTIIRVVHPVTLEQYNFTLAQDMLAGSLTIPVVSTTVTNPLPRGSYIYTNPGDGAAALIIGQDSIRLIAETASVGVTTTESLGPVTSIEVVLNTRVQAGDDLFLVRTLDARKLAFTVDQTAGPGLVTLQLNQLTTFDAPAGSYIIGSNAKYEGLLQVTPAGVLAKAEAVTTQNSFAILSAPLSTGTYTSIPVTSARTLKLKDGSVIGLQDKAGNTEFFTIDGDQNLTPATTTIAVESETTSTAIGAGAGVFQPSWNQTSTLSVQADQIALRVTEAQVQAIVDENLGGLLPAENWLFENTDEGFTTNNVTLTNSTTYVEYLATGSTPYIQKTGLSIDADDNPVVTIRVERVAGTNWGGAFGWTTDGTNYFTQTFVEPSGVDLDFQFATIDLTSNGNYTGTVTGVRLYLGEANLDEFYVDQFTIGKFNPQTEILADLSSRLSVAEGAITVEAGRIDLFTEKSQELNRIAEVTGTYNQSSSYTSITLTNIRSGFDIRDNQVLYLVNVDGTFQSVTANGNQSPLASPLAIDSVTFSTTISAGAMLYEAAFTQTSRITQAAGQIVLKAQESAGEVTSLALVRLDASASSGSAVKIQGDLVAINDIQITRGAGATAGVIQTSNFVSGSTGWRIRGSGDAEFNDVTVRGTLGVSTISENLSVGTNGAISNNTSTPAVTFNREGINMVYQPYTTDLGSGIKWNQSTTLKGVIWNDESEGDNTLNYLVTDATGRHLFGAGTSDPDERFEINANFVRTGSAQGLRVFGDFQARGDLRIYDSDESHYYNIVGGNLAGNIQLNLPVLTADRTFAFIDQAQTFSAAQTFTGDVIVPNSTTGTHALNVTTGDGRYARLGSANTITGATTFTGGLGVQATAGGIATIAYAAGSTANRTFTLPSVTSAATVAVLEHAQTFTGANTFSGDVIVPNSTTSNHALNVTTADSRYARVGSANTFTGVQTFNSRIDLFADARIYEGGANFYATLTYSGASNTTSTLPEATGTLVTTANLNQDIAGTKRFTGTLRASAYRSSDNTAGATDSVSVLDSNANVITLNFKNGLFVGYT